MTAIYPGSFDPITFGHKDIIKRAADFTDKLIVAVLENPDKTALFTVEERITHIKHITKDMENVHVESFSGLLVDFAKKHDAKLIVRGLRALTDFEYEFQMALANRELSTNIETIFIPTSIQHLFISSSVVKEIAKFGGDFASFVPDVVIEDLMNKYHR